MFRFTIRDVLWLTVVVGMRTAWGIDRWQQNIRMQITTESAGNRNLILRHYVDALTRALQSRGHRVEIIGGKVLVDEPAAILQPQSAPSTDHRP
jgi:hypothetical protein